MLNGAVLNRIAGGKFTARTAMRQRSHSASTSCLGSQPSMATAVSPHDASDVVGPVTLQPGIAAAPCRSRVPRACVCASTSSIPISCSSLIAVVKPAVSAGL